MIKELMSAGWTDVALLMIIMSWINCAKWPQRTKKNTIPGTR